jgi:sRNA-binding protein
LQRLSITGLKCVGYDDALQRRIANDAPAWDKRELAQQAAKRAQRKAKKKRSAKKAAGAPAKKRKTTSERPVVDLPEPEASDEDSDEDGDGGHANDEDERDGEDNWLPGR